MDALKKIWNIFTTVLVAAVLLLAVALVGVRLVGLQPYTVLSGSMEPAYHTGSLIYVKSVDYRELRVGDPITFLLSEDTIATHRIVEIVPDEEEPETLRYRTKGDANETEDGGLVHYKNVIGSPVFTIPHLGFVASYIQNPPGTYYALMLGAFAILLVFLPELIKALKSDGEEDRQSGPEKAPKGGKRSAESGNTATATNVKRAPGPVHERPHEKPAPRTSARALPQKKKGRHEL